MPAPNEWTPQFAMLATEMERAGIERQADELRQLRRLLRNKHVLPVRS